MIAWLELAAVLIIAPLLLMPGRIIGLAWHPLLIGLLLLLRIIHMAERNAWVTTPLDLAVWLLAATLPLALWVSVDKPASWVVAGYIVFGIALYFALANWPPAQRMPVLDFFLLMLVASALLLVGIGATARTAGILLDAPASISQFGLPAAMSALSARFGEEVNVNILLSLAAFIWPFTLALALVWRLDRYWWTPLLGIAGSLFLAYLIFVGRSRGSILALGAATIVVLIARWPRLVYAGAIIVPLLAVAVYQVVSLEHIQGELYRLLSIGGLSGRQEIWRRAVVALDDFGYTGIGLGLFAQVIPLLYPYGLLQNAGFPHAHNLFLQVGLDLGIIGLVAYSSIWAIVLYLLIGLIRTATAPTRRALAMGALGASAALLGNGLVDIAMWGTKLSFIPWILFALVVHLAVQPQNRAAQ